MEKTSLEAGFLVVFSEFEKPLPKVYCFKSSGRIYFSVASGRGLSLGR